MADQKQFLDVMSLAEAHQRLDAAMTERQVAPIGRRPDFEWIRLSNSLGRVLDENIIAPVNLPSFDRSNFDGFALNAADTIGAEENNPKTLELVSSSIAAGTVFEGEIKSRQAIQIATGAPVPRGANAVLMIEHSERLKRDTENECINVTRSLAPGDGLSYCASDVAIGETVFYAGRKITSRESAVLAALGITKLKVVRPPRVAIFSTGDEVVEPGASCELGQIFDSNGQMLADYVRELDAIPIGLGIVRDDLDRLAEKIDTALVQADFVVLSGGTSKGQGDLCYRILRRWSDPGVLIHGVAIKPGKPTCIAVHQGKLVVVLPGFPASARFTFEEFVAPLLRAWSGMQSRDRSIQAITTDAINSAPGRSEFIPVGLIRSAGQGSASQEPQSSQVEYRARPLGRNSGSVSNYARCDGFFRIDEDIEFLDAGATVDVETLIAESDFAELVIVGSHCLRVDHLLSQLETQGIRTRYFHTGSTAGLIAVQKGDCDIATVHLFDEKTGRYNIDFVGDGVDLIEGYPRKQVFVFRRGDQRFSGKTVEQIFKFEVDKPDCLMINRNPGSGTRSLIDRYLKGRQPSGYFNSTSSHSALVAAVAQGRADWGVAIDDAIGKDHLLECYELAVEQFDFLISKKRAHSNAVKAFLGMLRHLQQNTG